MALALDLSGRVVLVTGGTRGIGLGITEAFRAAGARVLTCSRSEVDATDHYVCDVRDPDAVQALVTQVVADAGRLDVLVNNAGGAPYALAADASARFHDKIVGLNLLAPAAVRPGGQRGDAAARSPAARSSTSPRSPPPGPRPAPRRTARPRPASTRSPSSLAVEWGPKVRVNSIDVGLCRTEDTADHYGGDAQVAAIERTIPLGPDGPARGGRARRGLPRERPRVVRLRRSGRVPRRGRASRLPLRPGRTVMSLLEGRVAIVTGAGRGIGRAHALELAAHGAAVVVNDYGVSLAGEGTGESPADEVVAAITSAGGRAVANGADVADFEQAAAMVQQAIDTFGGPRHPRQQRRLRARPDARQHLRGGVGRGDPGAPQGALRSAAARRRLLAGRVQGGPAARGPRHQHELGRRAAGLGRPGDVLRRQGRHRRAHPGRRPGAGAVRRHGQRDRTGGEDPDDRGCLRHLADGAARGQLADRRLARLRGGRRRDRPGDRDRRQHDHRRDRLGARPLPRRRPALGRDRGRARPCASCWPRRRRRSRCTAPSLWPC